MVQSTRRSLSKNKDKINLSLKHTEFQLRIATDKVNQLIQRKNDLKEQLFIIDNNLDKDVYNKCHDLRL